MKRTTLILTILGFVLITALWWFFLISPKNTQIDDANVARDEGKTEQSILQAQISSLRAVADNELTFLFALGEMESSVPSNPELDAFIEDLTFLADTTGIELSSIASSVPVQTEGSTLFTVTVALSFEGEYFEVLGFLYGLEDLERLVVVDSLGLSPIAEEVIEETTEEEATEEETTEEATEETISDDSPRDRPSDGRLSVSLSARLFTRSTVAVPVVVEDGGDGS